MKDTMMKDVDLSKAYHSATGVKENIDSADQAEWDLRKAYLTAVGINEVYSVTTDGFIFRS